MTITVILKETSEIHTKLHLYRAWLIKNVLVPGEPRAWRWTTTSNEDKTALNNVIEFREEEDAIAFKLTFGL